MPKVKYFTIWIAILIILVFALQNVFPAITEGLILNKSAIYQPWRVVTAIFLHANLSHLIFNLFALVIFGFILERLIGSKRFLLIFFVSGILANVIAFNFYSSSLGASGAIMGIIGALAVIRPMMGVFAFGVILPMFIAAIIWVAVDAIGIFVPDNTGHIAHLSGIFVGILFGIFLRKKHEERKKRHNIEIPEHMLRRWESLYMGARD
ncbi:MAG: rhomboid family intramembrane serine protease [Candidatus Pacearchaeota archaeon]|jgi:hypothetical protein